MKVLKVIFLMHTCIFIAQNTYAMLDEDKKDISLTAPKFHESIPKKEEELTLYHSPQELAFDKAESACLPLRYFVYEYIPVNVPDDSLKPITPSKVQIDMLPVDILTCMTTFLNLNELGKLLSVSSYWKSIFDVPNFWRVIGLRDYGKHLTPEDLKINPKQKVISNFLKVQIRKNVVDLKQFKPIEKNLTFCGFFYKVYVWYVPIYSDGINF